MIEQLRRLGLVTTVLGGVFVTGDPRFQIIGEFTPTDTDRFVSYVWTSVRTFVAAEQETP